MQNIYRTTILHKDLQDKFLYMMLIDQFRLLELQIEMNV